MWKLIVYSVLQSLLLCGGQVFLKLAMMRMPSPEWSKTFCISMLTNWQLAACGASFALASMLWMYMMKLFPFSMVYPMISLSYVFGMLAAVIIFHEDVSLTRWTGLSLIIIGCLLIAK